MTTEITEQTTKNTYMNFAFIKAPKEILLGKAAKNLSPSAKLLYIALIDRLSISIQNGWRDENGEPYIIFTGEEAMQVIGCTKEKMAKVWSELEGKCGEQYIKRKRQAVGKPYLVYVMTQMWKEVCKEENDDCDTFAANTKEGQTVEMSKQKSGTDLSILKKALADEEFDNKTYENEKSDCPTFENRTSDGSENEHSFVRKSNANYNNINNKNNINYINSSIPSQSICDTHRDMSSNSLDEWQEVWEEAKEFIMDQIGYESYKGEFDMDIIDDIVNILTDALCTEGDYVRVGKHNVSIHDMKRKIYALDRDKIEYVYENFRNTKTKIHNVRAYILTMLYRSGEVVNSWLETRDKF